MVEGENQPETTWLLTVSGDRPMKIQLREAHQNFTYRIHLEPEDHLGFGGDLGVRREMRLVQFAYQVNLPSRFRHIHPDAHAAAIWLALRPTIGRRLWLPFGVSRVFAARMEALFQIEFPRIDDTLSPRSEVHGMRAGLLFSGGVDSLAAASVIPKDTPLLFMDRIPYWDPREYVGPGDTLVDLSATRGLLRKLEHQGHDVLATRDDHEALFEPYPHWHSPTHFNPALYLADSLGLSVLGTGDVLDGAVLGGYRSPGTVDWRFKGEALLQRRNMVIGEVATQPMAGAGMDEMVSALLASLGLGQFAPVGGLFEVGSARIVHDGPMRGTATSCYYPSGDSNYCFRCDKCFKKLLLDYVFDGQEVSPSFFDHFLGYPYLAEIFRHEFFDWHHVWYYIFQRVRSSHPLVQELRRQTRNGPDLSLFEKWYPAAASAIPAEMRDLVVDNLLKTVQPMTTQDIETMHGLDVPPLSVPADLLDRVVKVTVGPQPAGEVRPTQEKRVQESSAELKPLGPPGNRRVPQLLHDMRLTGVIRFLKSSHLMLNTTTRCQNRCLYCFEGDRSQHRDLEPETVRGVLEGMQGKVPSVVFMGAEPTMNPDIVELVRHTRALGFVPVVSTNALRLANREFLDQLAGAGLMGLELSFPYPDAATFSRITKTGPSGFDALLKALVNLNELNRSRTGPRYGDQGLGINLNIVVSRFNYNRLPEILGQAAELLKDSPIVATAKMVGPSGKEPETMRRFLREFFVPLPALRQVFGQLLRTWEFDFPMVFRGYPLCAFAGYEELSGNLLYHEEEANSNVVLGNIDTDQDYFRQHHAWEINAVPGMEQEECRQCSLNGICLDRLLLGYEGQPRGAGALPSHLDPKIVLTAMGIPAPVADSLLAHPPLPGGVADTPASPKEDPKTIQKILHEASGSQDAPAAPVPAVKEPLPPSAESQEPLAGLDDRGRWTAQLRAMMLLAKEENWLEEGSLEFHPRPAREGVDRIRLARAGGFLEILIVDRAARASNDLSRAWQRGVFVRQWPPSGIERWKPLIRLVSSVSSGALVLGETREETRRNLQLTLRPQDPLLLVTERAVESLALDSLRPGDFRASWPTQDPDGGVCLSLTDGRKWIDLHLDESARGTPGFMSDGHTSLSYRQSGPVNTPEKKRAVERFFRKLSPDP